MTAVEREAAPAEGVDRDPQAVAPVRPLLAAALSFMAGVALGAWLPQHPAAWGCAATASVFFWALLVRGAGSLIAATRLGIVALVAIGIFRVQADLGPLYAGEGRLEEGDAVVHGRIFRPPDPRQGEVVLHIERARLRRGGATTRLALPLQVIVAGEGAGYAVGDLVTARGKLRNVRGDRNFGWFPGPVSPRGRQCAAVLVVGSDAWVRRDGHDPGSGPGGAVLRWRARADAFWKAHPGASAQILNALTTGERAGVPPDVQESFRRSGLTHLLAISGMNVAFLAALVYLGLWRALALWERLALRLPTQPIAAALTLPALWFFMLFSGSQIPVARAVLSGAAALSAVVLWRRVRPADACAIAALAIAGWDPRALFSASFQLSFAAVAAVLLIAPRVAATAGGAWPAEVEGRGWRLRRGARSLLLVSLAASATTAPLLAFHFQQFSLVGPLANLVAVPFTGLVVLPAGWLALAASLAGHRVGDAVAALALRSADLLVGVAAWFSQPRWASLDTARPSPLLSLSLLVLAFALLPPASVRVRSWRWRWSIAAALAWLGWSAAVHGRQMLAVVLDVGQGLSCAVLLPGGGSLLYDAGPRWRQYDAGERVVVPALRRLGVTRLETLVVSHGHPDHAGGVDAVLRSLGADSVWRAEEVMLAGELGERTLGGGVRVRVLGPAALPGRAPVAAADTNDGSLSMLLSFGETGVVFTGDAGPAAAVGIAARARPPPPHLALQVPHHGGSPEACRILAEELRPEVSAISVGRNTYGHPRPGAVNALSASGRVLRTDRDGAIFVHSDGRRLEVRTWAEQAAGRTWSERLRWLIAGW